MSCLPLNLMFFYKVSVFLYNNHCVKLKQDNICFYNKSFYVIYITFIYNVHNIYSKDVIFDIICMR